MQHGQVHWLDYARECMFCGDFVFTVMYSVHCNQELCVKCWLDEDAFFMKMEHGQTLTTPAREAAD